ncbi:hypothetical protein DV736_g2835, partial [Chaetothyriales sp. CBS 134916]
MFQIPLKKTPQSTHPCLLLLLLQHHLVQTCLVTPFSPRPLLSILSLPDLQALGLPNRLPHPNNPPLQPLQQHLARGDELDVYDPADSFDLSTPAPLQPTLDRNSQSPEQENGSTPLPVQTSGDPGASSSSSSALPAAQALDHPAEAAAATPPVTNPQVQASPPRAQVNGLHSAPLPKPRLSHDVIGILEDRIKDDPRGDSAAYLELITELKSRNKQDDVRTALEQYLRIFPLDAEQWCAYLRWEEEHDRKYQMEQIFSASLLEVLNVDLWSIYINYIRRRNNMQTGDVAKAYSIINQAFSFALDTIGVDKDSGKLWQDYIGFLKTGPGTVGGTGWQDGAKVDTIRAAYQRAIAIPTEAVMALWRDYDQFETGLSKINGRKYLQEKSAAYMTARQSYHQLSKLTANLDRTTRARLPPAMGYSGDDEYSQQLNLWQDWIQWEKDDNLVLKEDEPEVYKKRVVYVYKQALMALYFWPEMWYSAAEFCFEHGLDAEGSKFLEKGFAANPESPLLAFKIADRLESTTQNDETTDPGAKERMRKVREPYDKVLDSLYALTKKVEAAQKEDIQQIEINAESNTNGHGTSEDEVNVANIAIKQASVKAQIDAVKKASESELDLLSKLISHVWIAVVRATRRIQGKGSTSDRSGGFRAIFFEARKRGKLTSDFYVVCAQIEWQCYRDPAGAKIFERGIKVFPDDAHLPLHYIKHLFETNDVTNARGVFETTITKLLASQDPLHTARTKPLFAFMHDYESRFGELAQIQKLEKRMRQVFPDDPHLRMFAERYISDTFDPIHVFPIISRQQMQPKSTSEPPSIQPAQQSDSPVPKALDSIGTNSPKRALPDDFDDQGARKIVRTDSPLRGAAGRKVNQQKQSAAAPPFPLPPPLPPQVHYLLSVLPKASLYNDLSFIPNKVVEKLREIHLPPPGSMPARPPQQAPPQQGPPPGWQQPVAPYQHLQPAQVPPQGYLPPPPTVPPSPYGAPYRFP